MKQSVLEKQLTEKFCSAIENVTPGMSVRAYQSGRVIVDISVGKTFPYYDLASLTKPIFTVQAMMWAYEQNLWTMDTLVSDVLPWFQHKRVFVKDLLSHTSGLPWWLPVHKQLSPFKDPADRHEDLRKILETCQLEEHDKAVYSDVGFWVLGFVLEKLFQKDLYSVWEEVKAKFYSGTTFEFHRNNQALYRPTLYAPTEEGGWRGKVIQGEVHDDNAWAMGGVAPHAGLFGSIDDLGWYVLLLRSQILGIARYTIRQKTVQLFAKRSIPEEVGDWALGYMLPTPGVMSCGPYFSRESIGHTGFTGTSFWYDPKADFAVIILSNRVLYGRDNHAFKDLRPQVHNWIVEAFKRNGSAI
jgi:CubicO group peptidase (beta-lactamase class C family)